MSSVFLVTNFIDLIKQFSSRSVDFIKITQLALSKIPYLIHESLPYIIFIAAIIAFQRLARKNEYTILKASGLSLWQFLIPFITIGFIIGTIFITIVNPISSSLRHYQKKELAKILDRNLMSFSLFQKGVWFVDKNIDKNHIRLVNSQFLDLEKMQLSNATFLTFSKDFNFISRIHARTALLIEDQWELQDVTMFKASQLSEKYPSYKLLTNLQYDDIKDSLVEPNSVSMWELPYLIQNLQQSGYSTTKHISYLYKILTKPVFICALIILAASFALQHGRNVKATRIIFYGALLGFGTFFLGELTNFLGSNGQLSPLIANLLACMTVMIISLSSIYHSNEI